MKRIIAIALFAIATLITAGSASAQSAALKVDVPFNFTVSTTFLPAGSYEVGFDSVHPNVLVIQNRMKNLRATAYAQRGSIERGREDRLVFHRYGSEYFLSEVGFDSASDGVSLPVTKLESRARAGRTEELAFLAGH